MEDRPVPVLTGANINQWMSDIQLSIDSCGLASFLWDANVQYKTSPTILAFLPAMKEHAVLGQSLASSPFLYERESLSHCSAIAWRFNTAFLSANTDVEPLLGELPKSIHANVQAIMETAGSLHSEKLYEVLYKDQLEVYSNSMKVLEMIKNLIDPSLRHIVAGCTSPLVAMYELDRSLNSDALKNSAARSIHTAWDQISATCMEISEYLFKCFYMAKQLQILENPVSGDLLVETIVRNLPLNLCNLGIDVELISRIQHTRDITPVKTAVLEAIAHRNAIFGEEADAGEAGWEEADGAEASQFTLAQLATQVRNMRIAVETMKCFVQEAKESFQGLGADYTEMQELSTEVLTTTRDALRFNHTVIESVMETDTELKEIYLAWRERFERDM